MNERRDCINENLSIYQKTDGLTFGTDAYLLYAYIPDLKKYRKAADLGAGTGVISLLALAANKFDVCYGIEIQDAFCDLIKRNANENGLESRLTAVNKDLREVNASDTDGLCDCVFTNPPYMRADSGFHNRVEEKNVARREINGDIGDFCRAADRLLKNGGSFFVVYRPDRVGELICAMSESGIEPKRLTFVYPDRKSPPSLLLCEGRKGGAPGVFVTRGLFMYEDGERKESEDLKYIYSGGNFDESFRKA